MSNRALAIVGFLICVILFGYQLHVLHGSVDDLREATAASAKVQTVQVATGAASDTYMNTVGVVIENELEFLDGMLSDYLIKQQPELKLSIRYREFEKLVFQKRGAKGLLRWKPLRTTFGADYDALAARFKQEYPTTDIPNE